MLIKLVDRGREGEAVLLGRLDAATAPKTWEVMEELTERFDRLVVNMAGLEYLTSDGLGILKKTYMAMQQKSGTMTLSHVKKTIMEVLEINGVTGWLEIES